MKLEFTKLNGLGNDFVFIDDLSDEIELTDEQVAAICDRNFGVGADGVILVRPSSNADCAAYMHYINSDGTLAQMCGNGVRCFAKYLVDRGFVEPSKGSFIADTMAGERPIDFEVDENGKLVLATVNMGRPIFEPAEVPVNVAPNSVTPNGEPYVRELPIPSPWGEFKFTCVSMGNPHAVCFIEDFSTLPDALFTDYNNKCLETFEINAIGAFYESNPIFPEKTNVEFAEIRDEAIAMRVYERGCGETLACGTGTCATIVAATLVKGAPLENDVQLKGGVLHIDWKNMEDVFMTGTAKEAFQGTIEVV